MKATLRFIDNQYILTKTQDTIELKEPMADYSSKRYIVLQHHIGGNKVPYLLPSTKLNVLERANLVSDIYEIIAADNINGVKNIRFSIDNTIISDETKGLYIDEIKQFLGQEINYTTTNNEVIIQL